jgi:hypothetical protein
MSDTTIYIELSPELEGALADNYLSIEDILRRDGIEATVTSGVLPVQTEEGARTKDVVTIIIASSVLVASIAWSISHVINTINSRPHKVEYDALEPLRDAEGNPVFDAYGEPILHKVKRFELLVPDQRQKAEYEANLDLVEGSIAVKFTSEQEKQD